MMAKLLLLLVLTATVFFPANIYSQTTPEKTWGAEVELIQPFLPEVGIITIKGTKQIVGMGTPTKGDLLFGVFLRPNVSHDIVETIDEYMLSLGYRQFFWEGLHAEASYYAGYVWGEKNKIDGKDYEGFSNFAEIIAGYKFDFLEKEGFNLYVTAQFGYLMSLNEELIIGPRGGKEDNFIEGKLLIGINF